MRKEYLKDHIVLPVLEYLDAGSQSAVNLIMGTCAQETSLGAHCRQIGFCNGDEGAFGIYQTELDTVNDLYANFISNDKVLLDKISYLRDSNAALKRQLMADPFFATAICRLHYMRFPEPLPQADDLDGLAIYWKKYYNTNKGRGTEAQFISNYKRYVK